MRPSAATNARERVLKTAYELFSRHGVAAVGVDRIVAEAGVAKMTLYRHFRSKEELAVAALDHREKVWTEGWLIGELERREATPAGRLLAIFDLFGEWFERDDFEGCLLINALLESHDRTTQIGAASAQKLQNIRAYVKDLADELGVADAHDFAREWQTLMAGSIVMALQGDPDAARTAKETARLVLEARLGS